MHHFQGYALVSRLLAILLLVAVFLQSSDISIEYNYSSIFHISLGKWHWIILALEMGLAMGALVGICPQLLWWLLLAYFFSALLVSSERVVAGATSCGCFGKFHVHPWIAVVLDSLILLILAYVRPKGTSVGWASRHLWVKYVALLTVGWSLLGINWYWARARYAEEETIKEISQLAMQEWVGRRFPLINYIDVGLLLREGRWLVMLYHPDCSECRSQVPMFVGLAHQLAGHDRSLHLALIEVLRSDEIP